MYKFLLFFSVIFLGNFSCTTQKMTSKQWSTIFTNNNVSGTFILYNTKTKQYGYYDKIRANKRFLPASTFKILNSLIALETKVIKDENEIIKWDGIDRGWSKWNQDHNMKSAIAVSCIWFYQELARRIGTERMQNEIENVNYGNMLMGSRIDDFWLKGDIKISAKEQIKLLNNLVKNKLPFKIQNQEIVKEIMISDSTENYIVHSKSGWGVKSKPQIGWYVGYVEKKDNIFIFSLNIDIKKKSDAKSRKKIVYDILKLEGIIE